MSWSLELVIAIASAVLETDVMKLLSLTMVPPQCRIQRIHQEQIVANVISAEKRRGGWGGFRNQGSLEASASCNLFITSFTFRRLGLPLVTRSKPNEFQDTVCNWKYKAKRNMHLMYNHKVLDSS